VASSGCELIAGIDDRAPANHGGGGQGAGGVGGVGGAGGTPCGLTIGALVTLDSLAIGEPGEDGDVAFTSNGYVAYVSVAEAPLPSPMNMAIHRTSRRAEMDTFDGPSNAIDALADDASTLDSVSWISDDELTVYLTSDRAQPGMELDILRATRAVPTASWSEPAPVPGLVAPPLNLEFGAHVAADGSIYLASNFGLRAGDPGDLFRALPEDPGFGFPTRLIGVSSVARENSPILSADGLLLFFSSSRDTAGDFDVYVACRAEPDQDFSEAHWLPQVSSGEDDYPRLLSTPGSKLYIRTRENGQALVKVAELAR
jgi:hypothetical protein